MRPRFAFTLIELLVVIAIIAILAVVVVLTLNPAQLLAQARDANRVSDLSTLNSAINLYQVDVAGGTLGTSSVVYTSLPSATSTCDLGLMVLPSGYTYGCSSNAHYRSINGSGWVPLSFNKISAGAPFGVLPVDPTNESSSGLYYTYTTNGAQYELTASMESTKYQTNVVSVNGQSGFLAKGTNLNLNPINYSPNSFLNQGLVGYWPLNEGTGTTFYDLSGNGNNGTLYNGPVWTTGKVWKYALQFEPNFPTLTDQYVNLGTGLQQYVQGTSPVTFSMWYYLPSIQSGSDGWPVIFGNSRGSPRNGYDVFISTGSTPPAGRFYFERFFGGSTQAVYSSVASVGWHFVTATYNGAVMSLYIDGVLASSTPSTGSISPNEPLFLGNDGNYPLYGYGTVSDFRVYDRALSASEIQALYTMQK